MAIAPANYDLFGAMGYKYPYGRTPRRLPTPPAPAPAPMYPAPAVTPSTGFRRVGGPVGYGAGAIPMGGPQPPMYPPPATVSYSPPAVVTTPAPARASLGALGRAGVLGAARGAWGVASHPLATAVSLGLMAGSSAEDTMRGLGLPVDTYGDWTPNADPATMAYQQSDQAQAYLTGTLGAQPTQFNSVQPAHVPTATTIPRQHTAQMSPQMRATGRVRESTTADLLNQQSGVVMRDASAPPARYAEALADAMASGAPTFAWGGAVYNTPKVL